MSRSLKKAPFVDEYLLKKVEALRASGKKEIMLVLNSYMIFGQHPTRNAVWNIRCMGTDG